MLHDVITQMVYSVNSASDTGTVLPTSALEEEENFLANFSSKICCKPKKS